MTIKKQRSELIHRVLILLIAFLAVALFLEWRLFSKRLVEKELVTGTAAERYAVYSPEEVEWNEEEAYNELERIWQRLDRWFEKAVGSRSIALKNIQQFSGVFEPDIDLRENEKEYVVTCDLPGVDRDKIDVEVKGNLLTINGSREIVQEETSGQTHYYRECRRGYFTRTVILPGLADEQGLRAEYKDGILTIRLPKANSSRQYPARKVQVI